MARHHNAAGFDNGQRLSRLCAVALCKHRQLRRFGDGGTAGSGLWISRLNAYKPWVFEVGGYQGKLLTKTLKQLEKK